MNFRNKLSFLETKVGDICLAEPYTLFFKIKKKKKKKHFLEIKILEGKVNTTFDPADLITFSPAYLIEGS